MMSYDRTDTAFYNIGKIIWLPVVLLGYWFAQSGFFQISEWFSCSFYQVCGFPCPGCGGTRAVFYLFSGKFFTSFCYHPAVLYSVFSYLHFMLLYTYRKHRQKGTCVRKIHLEYYIYGMIAVVLLQWIVKLIYHF